MVVVVIVMAVVFVSYRISATVISRCLLLALLHNVLQPTQPSVDRFSRLVATYANLMMPDAVAAVAPCCWKPQLTANDGYYGVK